MAKARAAMRDRGKWKPGTKLTINLIGAEPVSKGSMKGFVVNWKPGQRHRPRAAVSDSKTTELKAYERDIREIAAREMNRLALPCAIEQPFEILVCYYLQRPNGDYHAASGELKATARVSPWTKPDLSKLLRATEDALTGMCWDDDSRIVRVVTEKRYATRERDVGLWIEVRVLPGTMRDLAEATQLASSILQTNR